MPGGLGERAMCAHMLVQDFQGVSGCTRNASGYIIQKAVIEAWTDTDSKEMGVERSATESDFHFSTILFSDEVLRPERKIILEPQIPGLPQITRNSGNRPGLCTLQQPIATFNTNRRLKK